jgi:hypothetical protein
MSEERTDAPAPASSMASRSRMPADVQADLAANPDYCSHSEYAAIHGIPLWKVSSWVNSHRLPCRVISRGRRIILRSALPPEGDVRTRVVDGVEQRRCGACGRWLDRGHFSMTGWEQSGRRCRVCALQIDLWRRAANRDPRLRRCKEIATLRDREIIAQRREGRAPVPSESRIAALAARAEADGLTGDGVDWRD